MPCALAVVIAPAPSVQKLTPISRIIDELKVIRRSERENRLIDHDQEGSMELKKREGYF